MPNDLSGIEYALFGNLEEFKIFENGPRYSKLIRRTDTQEITNGWVTFIREVSNDETSYKNSLCQVGRTREEAVLKAYFLMRAIAEKNGDILTDHIGIADKEIAVMGVNPDINEAYFHTGKSSIDLVAGSHFPDFID